MCGCIMHTLHIESISVHVNNPVKYSVYHPMAGKVCWDVEVMKCYFLPLSPLLELYPPSSAAEVAQRCQQHYSYLGWINWAGRQAWICLNHPLPLPVPQRAKNLLWADTDDGKQHSQTSEKQEGVLD